MRVCKLRVERRVERRVELCVERPRQWSLGSGSLGVVERRRVLFVWINELQRVGGIGALGFCSGVGVLAVLAHFQERTRGIYLAGKIVCYGWRSV